MKKIAYLVISCDHYSDVWKYNASLLRKFWPDLDYSTFILTNEKEFDEYGFQALKTGKDVSWSYNFLVAITQLKDMGYEYVFTTFDDFLLVQRVDTELLKKSISLFIKEKGNCLRFERKQCPKIKKYNDVFGEIYNNVPYRMILGFALWNIDTLLKLVDSKESAWEFEKNGVERSFNYDKFYCTYISPFKYINLIIKRKLVSGSYKKLQEVLPGTVIDRETWSPRKEKFKAVLLRLFMHHFPVKYQYTVYKKFSKPVKLHTLNNNTEK